MKAEIPTPKIGERWEMIIPRLSNCIEQQTIVVTITAQKEFDGVLCWGVLADNGWTAMGVKFGRPWFIALAPQPDEPTPFKLTTAEPE